MFTPTVSNPSETGASPLGRRGWRRHTEIETRHRAASSQINWSPRSIMANLPRSLARLCGGIAFGTSLAACYLGNAGVAAAASSACTTVPNGLSVVVASPAGPSVSPACVTQQGNVLIIVLPQTATGALFNTPVPQITPGASVTPVAQTAPDGNMANVVDPRINSYDKRQAIRDQYRGLIDEVTFNDELGDGVSLDVALAEAQAAFKRLHS